MKVATVLFLLVLVSSLHVQADDPSEAQVEFKTRSKEASPLVSFMKVRVGMQTKTIVRKTVVLNEDGRREFQDQGEGVGTRVEHKDAMSGKAFVACIPKTSVVMRVYCSLDNYYGHEFETAQDAVWSVRMNTHDRESLGHGYVNKESRLGKYLFDNLQDGKSHKAVVSISCSPDADSGSVFWIRGLHAFDTWEEGWKP